MLNNIKEKTSKVIAMILVVAMLITMLPPGISVKAFAATVNQYTVTLTDGANTVALDGVAITLTDKADTAKTQTQNTTAGVATFTDFADDTATYTVSVGEVAGYEAVADFEVTPGADTNCNVTLTASPAPAPTPSPAPSQIEISGTVTDENGNPYDGATVTISGGTDATATTAADGKYSFTVDSGKDYTVTATATGKEEKYNEATQTLTAPTTAQTVDLQFAVKARKSTLTFNITGEKGKVTYNGTEVITADPIEFNESDSIIISAIPETGYRVSKLVIDSTEELFTGNGAKVTDKEIIMDENHNIEVEFEPNWYGVIVNNIPEKGTVTIAGNPIDAETKVSYNDRIGFYIETVPSYTIETVKINGADADWQYNNISNVYVVESTIDNNSEDGENIKIEVTYEDNNQVDPIGENDFKNNVIVELTNGGETVVFDGGTAETELESLDALNSSNTKGLVISNDGANIVLKPGTTMTFKNKNMVDADTPYNIRLQFAYSEFDPKPGESADTDTLKDPNGWYNPKSGSVTITESCQLTNIQVKPDSKNLINESAAVNPEDQAKKYTIIIDNTPPQIDSLESSIKDPSKWVNSGNSIDISGVVSDNTPSSGLSHIVWSKDNLLSEEQVLNDTNNTAEIKDGKFSFNPEDIDQNSTYYVYAVDVAGNVSNAATFDGIKIDKTHPIVSGFSFESIDPQYNEGDGKPYYKETVYGYYFKTDTKVTVSATDDGGSGVVAIMYRAQDIDGNIINIEPGEFKQKGTSGTVTFVIPANFKGQIYASPIDKSGMHGDSRTPNGIIIEEAGMHEKEEGHITFTKPDTSHKTGDGKDDTELYSSNVPVTIIVKDKYSGIRQITWSVADPINGLDNPTQTGTVKVGNDQKFTGDDGWSIRKTDSNLVTEMQKTITVDNDSNDITVNVTMTDRAGNSSTNSITFSIDKSRPEFKVEYDNTTADETYKDLYKANRKATVTVTDRNFDPYNVTCTINNTDGVIPKLSDWTLTRGTNNTYTATVDYVADGDYTFDISCVDRAGNRSKEFEQDAFTIDKTMPTVKVSYADRSEARTDGSGYRYFKDDRTATIEITEHNFDPSRVDISKSSATDNGTPVTFPSISSWSDNGDIHTATITYSSDARYAFDIEFEDKAGNPISDFKIDEFCVDKTAPEIEITGVEDRSANNGTVAPIVTCTDTNFNRDGIDISLVGVRNSTVNYGSAINDIANGREIVYSDFERIQEVDDIYILEATITDYAGNETTEEITFSANRFGSVYAFERYLQEIEGKYTNVKEDIVFTETNVDTLQEGSVRLKLFKDGTPTDLVEGTDYDVVHTGGYGSWNQYTYTVHKDLIDSDGKYRLTVYSQDAAGNINENIEETKEAEISFGIDTTNPVIVPIDLEDGVRYPVEVKTAKAEIKDNLVLANVDIYFGEEIRPGNKVEYTVEGETYTFDIPEKNEKQSILFVATDAAGNTYQLVVKDFLVTTNRIVRWYNNTPVFIGSIVGAVAVAGGIFAFIILGKKKKEDEEAENQTL